MTVIYIGEDVLDLKPNTIVAVTLQRADIKNITARNVSRANQITAPQTPNNLRLFGIENSKSFSNKVYTRKDCRVVQNGYETLVGTAFCTSVEDGLRIQIYESDVDYIGALKDKTLFDIAQETGYTFGESGWTSGDLDTFRNNTNGVIPAVIDWGRGTLTNTYILPSYFYRTAMLGIASKINIAGVDFGSNSLLNSDIDDLVLTGTNEPLEYSNDIKTLYNVRAESVGTPTFSHLARVDYITNVISEGGVDIYDGPNGELYFEYGCEVNVKFVLAGVYRRLIPSIVNGGLRLRFNDVSAGTTTTLFSVVTAIPAPTVGVNITLTATVKVSQNDRIFVDYFGSDAQFESLSGSYCEAVGTQLVDINFIHWDYLLPARVLALDVLKDWATRFYVIFKNDGNNLRIKKLNDILKDRQGAIDWTGKRVRVDEIDYKTTFAKNNYITHANNSDLKNVGRGNLEIDYELADEERVLASSPFNGAETRASNGITCAYLPAYDSSSTGTLDVQKEINTTILRLRDKRVGEPSWNISGTPRTDYSIAFFVDPEETIDTGFQGVIDREYVMLRDALQANKVETVFYFLTEKDVYEYDPFKMVYDDGEYYLINRIFDFIPNKLTKVELLRI
jgi:hypothetical protein